MNVACVADGIVSAREIKFWRRSRQASREKNGERDFWYFSRLCRQNFILRAPTIPPATQARMNVHSNNIICRLLQFGLKLQLIVSISLFVN